MPFQEGEHVGLVDAREHPGGMAASRCECTRALGQALSCQRSASSAGGSEQQPGSGSATSTAPGLPAAHPFTDAYGTPTLTENTPCAVRSTTAVHQ